MMNPYAAAKPVEILLVEDNAADVRLTEELFKEGMIAGNIRVARDGIEAITYLRQEREYVEAPRPDLVLLDLNLPKKGGLDVLNEIKQDDALRSIPVIILTTSESEKDIAESYQRHANCYIVKPVDLDEFLGAIRAIEEFWFSLVRLPKAGGTGSRL